jgi:membrane carboxypeptidase/penicillin-binding protein PbpC
VFAENGVYFGQQIGGSIKPVAVLKVEGDDGSVWLDWSLPQAKPVVTPGLAYLMNSSLSDDTVRSDELQNARLLDIGRPAAVKLGQTRDGLDAWTIGYSPSRLVTVWTGSHASPALQDGESGIAPATSTVLWNALMQIVSQNQPPGNWTAPTDISIMNVCDPSGMLPTVECPNLVSEAFLNGNEPQQADNMFRKYSINRETGLLATVFTLPQLIEDRVYMVVPPEARTWAESAGLAIPPADYDVIQVLRYDENVNITSPQTLDEVSGSVQIEGTAAGDGFASYRVLVGQGLNPQEWILVGEGTSPVNQGVLAAWDTQKLHGLYAVELQVIRNDQRVDRAIIQVTVKNDQ